jgi:nicotinamidase-related amidase
MAPTLEEAAMEDPNKQTTDDSKAERREFLKASAIGLAGGAMLAATLDPKTATAQAAPASPTSFKYNRLSRENAAVLLVDHQAGLISLVQDYSPGEFKNNVLALANLAKYFKLPTILTTSFDEGPNGPIVPELKEIFPDAPFIPRPGQINAWDNKDFVAAIEKTGRKQLIIAGVVTDVCVAFPALSAIEAGYQVFAVVDASGTFNKDVRDAALMRMVEAGVQPMNWFAVACELHRDWRNDVEGLGALFSNHLPNYRNLMTSYVARTKK